MATDGPLSFLTITACIITKNVLLAITYDIDEQQSTFDLYFKLGKLIFYMKYFQHTFL